MNMAKFVHNVIIVIIPTGTLINFRITCRDAWEQQAANELKAQIKRERLGYADLAERLSAEEVPIPAHGLAKKLHRGAFSYAFFLRCAHLLEAARQSSREAAMCGTTKRER